MPYSASAFGRAAAALVERREEPPPRADPLPLPVVHAESIPHPAAANQPAGPTGAPGAGSAVSWYGCDPNFANQPNQLWTYAPVAHRANGDASTPSALVNIGSLASSQTSMDVRTAPILAAAANRAGHELRAHAGRAAQRHRGELVLAPDRRRLILTSRPRCGRRSSSGGRIASHPLGPPEQLRRPRRVSPAVDHDGRAPRLAMAAWWSSASGCVPRLSSGWRWAFGLGSTCFLVGPIPFYATLVGPRADAITFFVGSILFTAGGALQSWLARRAGRRTRPGGRPGGRRSSSPSARCSSTSRRSGPCRSRCPSPTTTGWSGGRTRTGRSASSSPESSPTGPRPGAAGDRGGPGRAGGSRRQPARLHLLRHRRDGRLRRGSSTSVLDQAAANDDLRRRRLLPRLRRRHGPGAPQEQRADPATSNG